MGREKSTEIFSFSAKKCPCSLFLQENSNCCSDQHEILIVDDTQNLSTAVSPVLPDFFLIGSLYEVELNKIIVQPITQNVGTDFSPPPKEPLYQLNCSIVFYDGELS
jgi:hypothetical protein